MDKLKILFRHKWTLPTIYLVLTVLLIMFAGPYFAFAGYIPLASLVTRLVLCSVIAICFGMYQYVIILKRQAKQAQLVDAISDEDTEATTDAIKAENKALKAKFLTAFDVLKETRGGKTSLLDLPWYMIIGSPGSGKTTLLSNSGLSFPLADKLKTNHLEGIGGTKNCDWWISNEAVLLDTAGRYTSQDSFQEVDQKGWFNFLNLIKRYRKKPISGIMLSISIVELLGMNEYELTQHIKQLKQRISEVNQHFNARFPIYVLLTKSDMLAGFTQFFDSFSHQEREQAFGLTFSFESTLDNQVEAQFDDRFAELVASIRRRQWGRMSTERDATRKAAIYSFCDQIGSLQGTLKRIVRQLSTLDDGLEMHQVPGRIRGVYFTSGTQNGAPIDRMLHRISQAFGLRHAHQAAWNCEQRSYFIKDLLQQIMFAEADQFGTLAGYEKNKKRWQQTAIVTTGLCSLLLCIALFSSFSNNAEYLARSNLAIDKWQVQYQEPITSVSGSASSIIANIPGLDEFSDVLNGLAAFQSTHFSGLGLEQSNAVSRSLYASYDRLLEAVLLPYILEEMAIQMRDIDNPVIQYEALKAYLMLTNPQHLETAYLQEYLLTNLNIKQRFTKQQYAQLRTHLLGLVNGEVVAARINSDSVNIARQALIAQALDEVYYQQFRKSYVSDKSNYLSLAQLAGANWRSVFETAGNDIHAISRFYTPTMYGELSDTLMQGYIDQVTSEDWVLGPQTMVNPSGMKDKFEMLYAQDYANQWQSLLNSVSIKQPQDIASLFTTLPILSKGSSPIFELLNTVSEATNFHSADFLLDGDTEIGQQFSQGITQALAKLPSDIDGASGKHLITERFKPLHELMSSDKKLSTEQGLNIILQEIHTTLNLQSKDLGAVSNPLSLNSLEGFGHLQVQPLERWINELSTAITTGKIQIRKTQLSNLWKQQIVTQCTSIVNSKFPFQLQSNEDATLSELNKLFSQNGIIHSFFDTYLAELVNIQTNPWRWKNNVQQQYGFNNQVLPFFEKSVGIRKALFANNPTKASYQITFTPIYLDPQLSRIRLTIYDTNMSYQFGRPSPQLVQWPPKNFARDSEIVFIRRDGSETTLAENGLFALAKFIEKAKVQRLSKSKVQVIFSKHNFSAIYEITANNGNDPLLLSGLSNFNCLSDL